MFANAVVSLPYCYRLDEYLDSDEWFFSNYKAVYLTTDKFDNSCYLH